MVVVGCCCCVFGEFAELSVVVVVCGFCWLTFCVCCPASLVLIGCCCCLFGGSAGLSVVVAVVVCGCC